MTTRIFTVLPMLTLLAFAAGSTATLALGEYQVADIRQEQLNNKYPENMKHRSALETALRRFEREMSGKRGHSKARSSKPKEIVVVGSKVKDVVRSPGAARGGFKNVEGLDSETDVVKHRDGAPPSLPRLKAEMRRFERAVGRNSPCVRRCKTTLNRCMSRCRGRLRTKRIKGRCICDHVQAHCLVRAARAGKCHPPDPGRRLRR